MVENEMQAAENRSKSGTPGAAGVRLANAARLGVLEKHLGVPIKRYRDPGNVGNARPSAPKEETDKDEVIVVAIEGG